MAERDPAVTKRRILDAAFKEFAARGVAGARVDRIAERAAVNKRMLYHYFTSKEGVFTAVLRRLMASRREALEASAASFGTRLARAQRYHAANPEYIRLLMWEALERGWRRAGSIVEDESRRAVYHSLVERVEQAQAAGALAADLDARQLVLSELALTMFPVAFPQLTLLITGLRPNDPAFLAQRDAFLAAVAEHLDGR